MSTTQLSPYLHFNGNCREAMEFYQSILGGKLDISTFGDTPMETPEDYKTKVMHCSLDNDSLSFMASDCPPNVTVTFGDNCHLSIMGSDEAQLAKFFNELSAGGTIDMPLEKQFWGDTFGMFTDKFGVKWMINIGSMGAKPDQV